MTESNGKIYGTWRFDRTAFEAIVLRYCEQFGVTRDDLNGSGRTHRQSYIRACICYEARNTLGASYCSLTKEFGFTREACAKACERQSGGYRPKRVPKYSLPPKPQQTPEERRAKFIAMLERNRLQREASLDKKIAEVVADWDGQPMDQLTLAARLGVSPERVRAIEYEARDKLLDRLSKEPVVFDWITTTKEREAC